MALILVCLLRYLPEIAWIGSNVFSTSGLAFTCGT
jgi:hypothetical protein